MKRKNTARLRFIVMIAVLALVAVGYFTAFGIGNVCGIGFDSITLLCPLGSLLSMIAGKTAIPMAVVSIVAVFVICVLLGKAFCSWVCPVHFLSKLKPGKKAGKKAAADEAAEAGEAAADVASAGGAPAPLTESERKLLGKKGCGLCEHPCGKSKGIKLDSRHGILAAALVTTGIFGFPVFCIICPVGLTFISVMLIMRLFAFGEATWTIVLFVAIILVEVILLPRWCKHFCPLGALLSLFSAANKTFVPKIDESKCLNTTANVECNRCVAACPEGINLHDIAKGETTLNDCSKCKACSDVCPASAITFDFLPGGKSTAKPQLVGNEGAVNAAQAGNAVGEAVGGASGKAAE